MCRPGTPVRVDLPERIYVDLDGHDRQSAPPIESSTGRADGAEHQKGGVECEAIVHLFVQFEIDFIAVESGFRSPVVAHHDHLSVGQRGARLQGLRERSDHADNPPGPRSDVFSAGSDDIHSSVRTNDAHIVNVRGDGWTECLAERFIQHGCSP